jgi:hypothetical protein
VGLFFIPATTRDAALLHFSVTDVLHITLDVPVILNGISFLLFEREVQRDEKRKIRIGSYILDARDGRPSSATCVEGKEKSDQRIRDNRKISIDEVSCEMSISPGKSSERMT